MGFLVIVVVLGYFLGLPWIAHRVILSKLHDAGFNTASFSLNRVSPFGLTMREVSLGDTQPLRVDTVRASFSLWSLWHGRLNQLEIGGGRITGRIDAAGHVDVDLPFRTIGGDPEPLTLPFDRLDIRDATVAVDWNGQHIDIPVGVSVVQEANNHIRVKAQILAASLRTGWGEWRTTNLIAQASLALGGGSVDCLDASINAESVALETPLELYRLLGVQAHVAFEAMSLAELPENLVVDHVEFRGEQFPGPRGTLTSNGRALDASIQWSPLDGVNVSARASAAFGDDGVTAEIESHIPAFAIEPIVRMADADGKFTGAEIAGTCAIDAQFQYSSNTLTPLINMSMRDVLIHNPAWTAQIDSASANLSINGLDPLATTPGQSVVISKGRFGTLELNDALAEFKVNDRNHIALQSLRWSLGDMGRFDASPFDLDLTQPVIRTTVSGKAIQLKPWLALLTGDRVRGEGELEGLLAIKIRPTSKFAIELGEGVLEATASNGYIQIRDPDTVNNLVSRMDLGGDDTLLQVRDHIVAAVQDFKYTMFRVEFMPDDDEVLCRIETKGVGRTGQKPQEIGGAVVNIHHFDDILRAVIHGKSLYDRME